MTDPSAKTLVEARFRLDQAKSRLQSTSAELQHRLSPSTLARDMWTGVRERGSELGDGAVQAVKERPLLVSGICAAIGIVLARKPLGKMMSGNGADADPSVVRADLNRAEERVDLTAPVVPPPVAPPAPSVSLHSQGVQV